MYRCLECWVAFFCIMRKEDKDMVLVIMGDSIFGFVEHPRRTPSAIGLPWALTVTRCSAFWCGGLRIEGLELDASPDAMRPPRMEFLHQSCARLRLRSVSIRLHSSCACVGLSLQATGQVCFAKCTRVVGLMTPAPLFVAFCSCPTMQGAA